MCAELPRGLTLNTCDVLKQNFQSFSSLNMSGMCFKSGTSFRLASYNVCLLGEDLDGSSYGLFKVMFHHFSKDGKEYPLAV
jgi:hypothetical protein